MTDEITPLQIPLWKSIIFFFTILTVAIGATWKVNESIHANRIAGLQEQLTFRTELRQTNFQDLLRSLTAVAQEVFDAMKAEEVQRKLDKLRLEHHSLLSKVDQLLDPYHQEQFTLDRGGRRSLLQGMVWLTVPEITRESVAITLGDKESFLQEDPKRNNNKRVIPVGKHRYELRLISNTATRAKFQFSRIQDLNLENQESRLVTTLSSLRDCLSLSESATTSGESSH